ncbi:alpha-1,2-mannosyltransferase [Biscogniauxia mediterranea]|nr:alpha-1,2-mannosyltransferase [Biscogniauxia mediterranea]
MATDEMLETVSKRAEEVYQGLKESSHHCASIAKASWSELRSNGQLQKLQQPVSIAIILLFLTASTAAYIIRRQNLKQLTARRPSTPTTPRLEKALKTPQREWGKWVASDFRTPKPAPYPNWSIEHTKPLPYRPFRYGPKYHVTMGLRSLKLDDWIELDNQFPRYHADKTQRIAEKGSKLCGTAPEAYPAAVELLEELTEYLPARYPSLFKRTEVGLDNLWSGESFDIVRRPLAEDPMQTCARLVQDDLAIMVERADGQYYLLAGCIVLPGFWRMQDKFGMPLSEIHTSGSVPQYKEKLEKGMMNLFRRLKPEEIVSRHNYFMQVDDGLPWSTSIGDEDDPDRERTWDTAEKDRAIEHHYYRSERQSLRRLPRTGGIVFTIRTYFHPIKEIAEEDYVPGRLASAVRSWGADVSKYKGKEKYGDVLLEFLDKKHEEQVARGLDLSREDEVRAYPF